MDKKEIVAKTIKKLSAVNIRDIMIDFEQFLKAAKFTENDDFANSLIDFLNRWELFKKENLLIADEFFNKIKKYLLDPKIYIYLDQIKQVLDFYKYKFGEQYFHGIFYPKISLSKGLKMKSKIKVIREPTIEDIESLPTF